MSNNIPGLNWKTAAMLKRRGFSLMDVDSRTIAVRIETIKIGQRTVLKRTEQMDIDFAITICRRLSAVEKQRRYRAKHPARTTDQNRAHARAHKARMKEKMR